jgi:sialic acid synthase SpsE
MNIGKKTIGSGSLYFVIEEGQATLGDFGKALQLIAAAAKTGADAIEFQLAIASDFYIKGHKGYDIYLEREFSSVQLEQLVSYTQDKEIDLVVAPFSNRLIDIMAKLDVAAFNINASDLNNPDILDAVSDCGTPFFLSLLLAEEKEIEWAIQRVTRRKAPPFGLLLGQHTMASGGHGVSLEHTNLGYIKTLKGKFNVPVGFIDHSPLVWMPACAVAAGADFVTKHMALSIADKGPDWQVCLEPVDMVKAIDWARKSKDSISNTSKELAPGERIDKSVMRRSIVAARQIAKGEKIEREDIVFKRPGTGIAPDEFLNVIGKIAARDIEADTIIDQDELI